MALKNYPTFGNCAKGWVIVAIDYSPNCLIVCLRLQDMGTIKKNAEEWGLCHSSAKVDKEKAIDKLVDRQPTH